MKRARSVVEWCALVRIITADSRGKLPPVSTCYEFSILYRFELKVKDLLHIRHTTIHQKQVVHGRITALYVWDKEPPSTVRNYFCRRITGAAVLGCPQGVDLDSHLTPSRVPSEHCSLLVRVTHWPLLRAGLKVKGGLSYKGIIFLCHINDEI